MNWLTVIEVGSALIAALATCYALYRSVRKESRDRAAAELAERQTIRDDAYSAGVRSQTSVLADRDREIEALNRELKSSGDREKEARDQVDELNREIRDMLREKGSR